MILNKYYIPLILYVIFSGCSFFPPVFHIDKFCLISEYEININYLRIREINRSYYYNITIRDNAEGTHKICLDNEISNSYIVSNINDTLTNDAIELITGDTIIISNSGGDRASYGVKVKVHSNRLEILGPHKGY